MARGVDEPWMLDGAVPPEIGRAWAHEWTGWFGPARVALPRAPEEDRLALVETELGRVVAKRERTGGWKRSLEALGARTPRCERAFRNAALLVERGFATPAPLAVLGRPGDSVLVTRFVEGFGPWEALRAGVSAERLCAALAENLARLHAGGFRHRDLKASNWLLRRSGEELEVVWTDLDGLERVGVVTQRVRARDLARLAASFESVQARAAGVRAGHWPIVVRRYLERALTREPSEEEAAEMLMWTRMWRERWIRRHLARGEEVL